MWPFDGTVDTSTWPTWLVTIAVLMALIKPILGSFSILVPPLKEWIERRSEERQAVVHAELDNRAFDQQQEARTLDRLLTTMERTLERQHQDETAYRQLLAELKDTIIGLDRRMERNNNILSALNGSLTRLSDKFDSIKWFLMREADPNGEWSDRLATFERPPEVDAE